MMHGKTLVGCLVIVAHLATGSPEVSALCGDGVIDAADGEQCDDGNTDDGDGCSATCQVEICGNGNLDPDEVCDDGNTFWGDGCSGDCLSDETCGNSIVDTEADEECDDGNTTGGDGCDASCLVESFCGDGEIDDGEECDDGNADAEDGCDDQCVIEEGYTCLGEPSYCSLEGDVCGDGVLDADEECDDGNTTGGDGCSAICTIETSEDDSGCGCSGSRTPGAGLALVLFALLVLLGARLDRWFAVK